MGPAFAQTLVAVCENARVLMLPSALSVLHTKWN